MAILDDSSLKIDPYYKTTNGYTHMYLASDDVLMNDDTHTLQTKMDDVDKNLVEYVKISSISVSLGSIAKSGVSKPTVDIPSIDGYIPILATIKGSGSNYVYNYYVRIDRIINGDMSITYKLYSEWKNTNASEKVTATANVNILYIRDYHNYHI